MFAFIGGFLGTIVGFIGLSLITSAIQRRHHRIEMNQLEKVKQEYQKVYEQTKDYIDQASLTDAATHIGTIGEA